MQPLLCQRARAPSDSCTPVIPRGVQMRHACIMQAILNPQEPSKRTIAKTEHPRRSVLRERESDAASGSFTRPVARPLPESQSHFLVRPSWLLYSPGAWPQVREDEGAPMEGGCVEMGRQAGVHGNRRGAVGRAGRGKHRPSYTTHAISGADCKRKKREQEDLLLSVFQLLCWWWTQLPLCLHDANYCGTPLNVIRAVPDFASSNCWCLGRAPP